MKYLCKGGMGSGKERVKFIILILKVLKVMVALTLSSPVKN